MSSVTRSSKQTWARSEYVDALDEGEADYELQSDHSEGTPHYAVLVRGPRQP